ncbi:ATP-binding protein [Streptomyces finlayi]|uniref:ATP-binding protein n=1 Tax=Streptomyces finlayi TaxID=67296 RepID=UPI001E399D78|nr:ATP-binding protein [Streptomyces finlayi]
MKLPITRTAGYDGSTAGIAAARAFAMDFLHLLGTRCGLVVPARLREVVPLVVSELTTNACKYAPGPQRLELEADEADLRLSLWDTSPALPVVLAADPGRIGQHGLAIVTALCQDYTVHPQPPGKRTTVRISLADSPGHTTLA